MKNRYLITFSQEHHHGLIFCSRLTKAPQTSDKTLKVFVADFWKNYLTEHFKNEETLLLPLLEDNEVSSQFKEEHEQIKKLIKTINDSDKKISELSLNLSKLLRNHIRFEERILFPLLVNTFNADKLETIDAKLKKIQIKKHTFKPEFWKNEN